jgi:hypothetical protein
MAQFTKKAALIILSVAVIAGCKKDDNKNSSTSKTQLLTTGNWKLTSDYLDPGYDVNGDGIADHEMINFYDACEKDNTLTFKSDGTVTIDEGPTKCNPTDPQSQSTTWKFVNNESQLDVGPVGSDNVVDLVQLSTTVLKIKETYTSQGVTYTETYTYGH